MQWLFELSFFLLLEAAEFINKNGGKLLLLLKLEID